MTPLQRHRCMSSIKSVDTKPEMLVRQWIWREGFRYRLHVKYLPGTPDIVIRKIKTVIFINGCFWHGHILGECYRPAKSNVEFWATKIQKTVKEIFVIITPSNLKDGMSLLSGNAN